MGGEIAAPPPQKQFCARQERLERDFTMQPACAPRTAAPLAPLRAVAAHAKAKRGGGAAGGGVGFGAPPPPAQLAAETEADAQPSTSAAAERPAAPAELPPSPPKPSAADAAQPADGAPTPLPAVSRDAVLSACLQTSGLLAALGLGIHELAPLISPAAYDGNAEALRALLRCPGAPAPAALAAAAAAAAGVTAARAAALAAWPAFREASDRSNAQALSPLAGPADFALVALLPAAAEELLFRGALLPAVHPDWIGAAVAGAVFGALHLRGGRNAAFAVWAGGVGCAYGALFLATGSLWAPVAAHGIANLAAGALWAQRREAR